MTLEPEKILEDLLQRRERAAVKEAMSLLTSCMLDHIANHAFVVRRWHAFSRKVEGYLKSLPEDGDAKSLRDEFYRIVSDIDEGPDLPPPEKPRPVIIRHVKWVCAGEASVPSANTTQLERLPELPRGTLIFVPEDEDYDSEPDEFSLRSQLKREP